MRRGRTRPLTRIMLVVAGVGLLAGITLWMLHSGSRGVDTATVLSFSVSVLSLAVAILAIRWQGATDEHEMLADSARALARDVGAREADQQQKFLADSGSPRPANVGFKQPALVRWRSDGAKRYGSMEDIKAFYNDLHHGRLVILGPGGAGKTVLANQLLLDLIGQNIPGGSLSGETFQVPIRMSLASFNPGDDIDESPPAQMRFRLDEWVASYLADVHGLNVRVAESLLRDGWILPVLDGLDEMDSSATNPRRAAAVIRSLNYPINGSLSPIVVTCRTDTYEQLATLNYGPGKQVVLQDATVVEIQPLTSGEISAYLTYRFPDPADPGQIQERWKPVLADITSRSHDPLATALRLPLRLFLAVTAYHDPTANPAELIQLPAKELDHYLIDQLIPAVTTQYPKRNGGTYNSDDVTRWLTTFAYYLGNQRGASGDPAASDIDLHNIWKIVDRRILLISAILRCTLVAAPLIVLVVFYQQLIPDFHNSYVILYYSVPWRIFFAGALVLVAAAAWSASQIGVEPNRLDFSRLRTAKARLRVTTGVVIGVGLGLGLGIGLTGGILVGLSLGLAVGLGIGIPIFRRYWRANKLRAGIIIGLAVAAGPDLFIGYSLWGVGATWLAPTFGIIVGLTAGITGGLVTGLAWGLTQRPAAISKPSQLVSQGMAYEFTLTIAVTVIVGAVFSVQWLAGFVSSLWPANSAVAPWVALGNVFKFYGPNLLSFYIPKAFLFGLACGIAVNASSSWLSYFATSRILAHQQRLPKNPAVFLDWAYNAGLVRLSGIHVQFRHDELQIHLSGSRSQSARYPTPSGNTAGTNPDASGQLVAYPASASSLPGSVSSAARPWRLIALSGTVLGALVMATATAPGVIAPAVGKKFTVQYAPVPFSVPLISSNSSAGAVVLAFLDAINRHDWAKAWQLGAKNLGISYAQMAHNFPKTEDRDIFITSAFGSAVTAMLVAIAAHGQMQVWRVTYKVAKGAIVRGRQSLLATAPAEGIFSRLAGNWSGHDRYLTISSHGLGIAQYRVFQNCNKNPSLPCDSIVGNYLYNGGVIVFQLTRNSRNQAMGFVLGASVTPPKSPVSIDFQAGDTIILHTATPGVSLNFCGLYSLPGYCGA